jgi:hypothetical protein
MLLIQKIFNYSPLSGFTGSYDRVKKQYQAQLLDGSTLYADNLENFMNEHSKVFLGYRTDNWWKIFPKKEFQNLQETFDIFGNFTLHKLVSKYVDNMDFTLNNGTDIQVDYVYRNDADFDAFNTICEEHQIPHGFNTYPYGATFLYK